MEEYKKGKNDALRMIKEILKESGKLSEKEILDQIWTKINEELKS